MSDKHITAGQKRAKISDPEFLKVIADFKASKGYPPTVRELMERTPLSSTSAVSYRLKASIERGYITQVPRLTRTISITAEGFQLIEDLLAGLRKTKKQPKSPWPKQIQASIS